MAAHWWTLDNPAQPLVRRRLRGAGSARPRRGCHRRDSPRLAATCPWRSAWPRSSPPTPVQNESRSLIKDLVVYLARAGVTATCSRPSGTRYGMARRRLEPARLPYRARRPVGERVHRGVCSPPAIRRWPSGSPSWSPTPGAAPGLWIPAAKARTAAFGPGADLRGPRDLPVLVVATADPGALDKAVRELMRDLLLQRVPAEVADDGALADGDEALADGAVAVFNRGTPGGGGHAGRDAVDVALPCLRRLAERGVDRRGPAGRAGRVVVRLATLVAHVQLRPRVVRRGGRLARGRCSTRPRRSTTTTFSLP